MSVFNKEENKEITPKGKKRSFAYVEKTDDSEQSKAKDVNEFINSGRGQEKKVLNPKGRPRLDDEERKKETIMIYVTKEQKDTLQEKAKNSSLSLSKYILLKVFGID